MEYFRITGVEFNSDQIPLNELNKDIIDQVKIMIKDEITGESAESTITWTPMYTRYEEQKYWIFSHKHIYDNISETIKNLLIKMNRSPEIFTFEFMGNQKDKHGDPGFRLIFRNRYQNFRFFFTKHLFALFNIFHTVSTEDEYYMIDTTMEEVSVSDVKPIYLPFVHYTLSINGKKLIKFSSVPEQFRRYLSYTLEKNEVVYFKKTDIITLSASINSRDYNLRGIECDIIYTLI